MDKVKKEILKTKSDIILRNLVNRIHKTIPPLKKSITFRTLWPSRAPYFFDQNTLYPDYVIWTKSGSYNPKCLKITLPIGTCESLVWSGEIQSGKHNPDIMVALRRRKSARPVFKRPMSKLGGKSRRLIPENVIRTVRVYIVRQNLAEADHLYQKHSLHL